MKQLAWFMLVCIVVVATGCATPASKIKDVRLGMTHEEVEDVMGRPFTIRAAKVFQTGESTEIWEYQPRFFELNPKGFWIYFENKKVVQWGEPSDFAGKLPVDEYRPFKAGR